MYHKESWTLASASRLPGWQPPLQVLEGQDGNKKDPVGGCWWNNHVTKVTHLPDLSTRRKVHLVSLLPAPSTDLYAYINAQSAYLLFTTALP